ANATPYLQAFGHTVLAWIWLEQAVAASQGEPTALKQGKLSAARYFFRYELPKIEPWLAVVSTRDDTCLNMSPDWF
uniref:acyl-CoA dehydrogenase C-terminal domain-containing protein n=1 Tax=Aquabacterium sp. TaxID=1872578 RepID=UPI0035B18C6B